MTTAKEGLPSINENTVHNKILLSLVTTQFSAELYLAIHYYTSKYLIYSLLSELI